jgi:hypothetical protein
MSRELDDMLQDAINKGLIYYSNTWIEQAVQQKCQNMTIEIASSKPYVWVCDRRKKEMWN